MEQQILAAYLRRIAVPRPRTVDAATLARLHRAHLMTVPFENLSIHLPEPISLDDDHLLRKIVSRRRGGFCYELNGAFALLLRALGADVALVAARVHAAGRLGPAFDHLALIVHLADGGGPWLADVGFGSHSSYPLLFDSRQEQDDPGGRFLLADNETGEVDLSKDGIPQYRIDPRRRALADFGPTCRWHQTSPESRFTQATVCSLLTEEGRVTINDRVLIRARGTSRTQQELPDDGTLLAAYRDHFGIILDHVPTRLDTDQPTVISRWPTSSSDRPSR